MVYATRITMKNGFIDSDNPEEIDEIYLSGVSNPGWYKKSLVHDFVKENIAKVNIDPYPKLVPEISSNNEKFVRSEPDEYRKDNLMKLPRGK